MDKYKVMMQSDLSSLMCQADAQTAVIIRDGGH